MASVPYSASYSEPQRALEALRAKRAFITGTTSCGPAMGDFFIDVLVVAWKSSGFWQQVTDVLQEGFVGDGVVGLALRAWCQASIRAWKSSRLASRALFFGARS